MNIDIKSLYELRQTAAFFGFVIHQRTLQFISLFEIGSEFHVAHWEGIGAVQNAINWCNWFFNKLELEQKGT